jgi:2,3-bisphosphoglycerate-independent phosphoglycerate mutase
MDRDNRWERVSRAYDAIIRAQGETAPDPLTAVSNSYGKGETDEFLAPTVIDGYHGAKDGDGVFCLNFRADRAREILAALAAPGFAAFQTGLRPVWSALLGMVEYSDLHNAYMATAFPKRVLVNT